MAHFLECGLRAYNVSLESAWRNLCWGWKSRRRCSLTPTSACRTWGYSATCGSPGGACCCTNSEIGFSVCELSGPPLEAHHAVLHAVNPRDRTPASSTERYADPNLPLLRRHHEACPDDPKIGSAVGTVHLRLPFVRRNRFRGSS